MFSRMIPSTTISGSGLPIIVEVPLTFMRPVDPMFPDGIMISNPFNAPWKAASKEVAPGVRMSLALTVEVAPVISFLAMTW